jgi:hypothetical protein
VILRLIDRIRGLFGPQPDPVANLEDLETLQKALEAGADLARVWPVEGQPLKIEDLSPVLRSVTYREEDIDLFLDWMVGRTFRNRKTGDTYVAVKAMKGKVFYPFTLANLPKIIRGERRWVRGLEYTSLEKGGASFWRERSDFLAKFEVVR